jgi:hypothetical protein
MRARAVSKTTSLLAMGWVAIVKDRAGGRAEAHERGRKVKARMRGTYDSKGAAMGSTGGARVCASNHMRRMSLNGPLWNTTSRASLWRKRSNVEGLLSVFQLLGSKVWFSQSRYTGQRLRLARYARPPTT